MKQLFFLIGIIIIGSGALAQDNPALAPAGSEPLVLKDTSFDFGRIGQGRPVTHEFEIMNGSADTLQLENVKASCGCTTPVWSKGPVLPGSSTKVNVGYNAQAEGAFDKKVTLYYNGGRTKTLTIKGNVFKEVASSAPVNTSVQLLKQTNQ